MNSFKQILDQFNYIFYYSISDPPEKPSPPTASDWDSKYIELEWRPPKKDGGTPVTTYVIEKRLKGSPLWDEAARVPGECTKTKITDVQEGEEYEFRLIAINKAGPSEPSDPTQPITAKPRFCKYFFNY